MARKTGVLKQVKEEFYRGINGLAPWQYSFRERIRWLSGISEEVFLEAATEMRVRPGAVKLTNALKKEGWRIAIITGGFDMLRTVIDEAGVRYDHFYSHKLVFNNGRLAGVRLGFRDKGEVARYLKQLYAPNITVAVGDGWNDLGMFREADLAVGYMPKCMVRPYVDVEVRTFRSLWRLLRLLKAPNKRGGRAVRI